MRIDRAIWLQFIFGLASGLPLIAIGSTLKARLAESGISLSTIGLYSWVGLPYTIKFLWAPLVDRYFISRIGRRKTWMLATQITLVISLAALAVYDPTAFPLVTAGLAVWIAFVSATQDIVLDAFRRDTLAENELGFGTGLFINGYRIGMLISGALALWCAEVYSWRTAYLLMAACFLLPLLVLPFTKEPSVIVTPSRNLGEAFLAPLQNFLARGRSFLTVLSFILFYKIGESLAGEMTMPFYLNIGFQKSEIALIVKTFGLGATMVGALAGGALMLRLGMYRSLWLFGIFQAVPLLGFAALAHIGNDTTALTVVIALENLGAGMATSAYAAFMAQQCDKQFSAAQYAVLSSLMGVPRVIFGGGTGYLAEFLGWAGFFYFCTALAIPGLILLRILKARLTT